MNYLHRILDISIELTNLGLNDEAASVLKILTDKILKTNKVSINETFVDLSSFPRDLSKILAIKLIRAQTKCSLTEADNFIEENKLYDPQASNFSHLDLIHSACNYAEDNGFLQNFKAFLFKKNLHGV